MLSRWIVSVLLTAALSANCLVVFLTLTSEATTECLTRKEARAKWPHEHLRWHGEDHCWDAHRWNRRDVNARRHSDPDDSSYVVEGEFNILDAQVGSQATWPRPFAPWTERVGEVFKQ